MIYVQRLSRVPVNTSLDISLLLCHTEWLDILAVSRRRSAFPSVMDFFIAWIPDCINKLIKCLGSLLKFKRSKNRLKSSMIIIYMVYRQLQQTKQFPMVQLVSNILTKTKRTSLYKTLQFSVCRYTYKSENSFHNNFRTKSWAMGQNNVFSAVKYF